MRYFFKAFLLVLIINSLVGISENDFRDEFQKRSMNTLDSKKYFNFPYSKFFLFFKLKMIDPFKHPSIKIPV
jgi:hypothetical protein